MFYSISKDDLRQVSSCVPHFLNAHIGYHLSRPRSSTFVKIFYKFTIRRFGEDLLYSGFSFVFLFVFGINAHIGYHLSRPRSSTFVKIFYKFTIRRFGEDLLYSGFSFVFLFVFGIPAVLRGEKQLSLYTAN